MSCCLEDDHALEYLGEGSAAGVVTAAQFGRFHWIYSAARGKRATQSEDDNKSGHFYTMMAVTAQARLESQTVNAAKDSQQNSLRQL